MLATPPPSRFSDLLTYLKWMLRYVGTVRGWGGRAPHILADQLTLSQTRGQIMLAPTPAPQIFRPSDIPEVDAQVYLKGANIINPW